MSILFVLLLVTHQAAGHLQCPQIAASFGGEIDLSSFSVLLEQPEGVGDGGNVNISDDSKLIARLTVHYYVVAIAGYNICEDCDSVLYRPIPSLLVPIMRRRYISQARK